MPAQVERRRSTEEVLASEDAREDSPASAGSGVSAQESLTFAQAVAQDLRQLREERERRKELRLSQALLKEGRLDLQPSARGARLATLAQEVHVSGAQRPPFPLPRPQPSAFGEDAAAEDAQPGYLELFRQRRAALAREDEERQQHSFERQARAAELLRSFDMPWEEEEPRRPDRDGTDERSPDRQAGRSSVRSELERARQRVEEHLRRAEDTERILEDRRRLERRKTSAEEQISRVRALIMGHLERQGAHRLSQAGG